MSRHKRPTLRFMLSHPAHIASIGFGSGLSPIMPGTCGTLAGWLIFALLAPYVSISAWIALIVIGFVGGIWLCGFTARRMQTPDPGAVVWDEIIAIWIVLLAVMPTGFWGQLICFVVFRFFDMVKPPPIRYFDQRLKGGFGIMFDDLVAAFFSLIVIALIGAVFPATSLALNLHKVAAVTDARHLQAERVEAAIGKHFLHRSILQQGDSSMHTPAPSSPATPDSLAATAATLGKKLADAGWMMVSAESCTGGMIATTMTDIAGSSAWFERAYVTYSNEAKSTAIGVSGELIAKHGAVSEPVAKAMAEGALAASVADVSVAVTGIAGPGGGSAEKPVGTVCFAWSTHNSKTVIRTHHFAGDRAAIRRQATQYALEGLNDVLEAASKQAPTAS